MRQLSSLRREPRHGQSPTPRSSRWLESSGGLAFIAHPREYAAHKRKALDHSRHGIVGEDLVLQVHKAAVVDVDQRLKDSWHRHHAITHSNLAFLLCSISQILHVNVENTRPSLANRCHRVSASAHGVTHIDAAANPRIQLVHRSKYNERRREVLVIRSMIMNSD